MAKANTTGMIQAAKEHLLSGLPTTRLEALILFGVSNLPEVVYELRQAGWVIKSRTIPYATAMVRVNKYAVFAATRQSTNTRD
ncbi:helix-turn-helix domain-containing protein [Magnetospirillum sp. 15-1]|uniref:helix-turn-helix domain-containing protein n=1 Tax=Magnetospirillum sp. 15-1 TaxID=1979370 RepID=UPI000BBCE766|nr:helix-turn-helix domain-containing protein [Magnetospirillum sp. 15-1]